MSTLPNCVTCGHSCIYHADGFDFVDGAQVPVGKCMHAGCSCTDYVDPADVDAKGRP